MQSEHYHCLFPSLMLNANLFKKLRMYLRDHFAKENKEILKYFDIVRSWNWQKNL